MSKTNGEDPPERAGPIDPQNKLSDGEYNNRRRIEAINDARERVADVVLEVEEALMFGQVNEYRASWAIHAAVKMFIRECQWVVKNHDKAEDLFYIEPIGWMPIARSEADDDDSHLHRTVESSGVEVLSVLPSTEPEDGGIKFLGLKSVMEAPREIEVKRITTELTHISGRQEKEEIVTHTIPARISLHAYDLLVDTLGDSDLNITFDGGRSLGEVTPAIGEQL